MVGGEGPGMTVDSQEDQVLECRDVSVTYGKKPQQVTPIQHVGVAVGPEPTALTGSSGSGNSSLLWVLAVIQAPSRLGFCLTFTRLPADKI
jgi:ABC-type lipoprotein export system ATPase subunit